MYSKYSYYWLLYMIMDGNGQYQASYCKNINVISNIWRKMTALGMADFGATPHVWTSHGGAEETPWQSWWHWSMVSGQDMWSSSHSAETLEEKGWDGGKYQCLMENDGNWMIDITFNDIGDYWLSPCIPHAPKYIYIYINCGIERLFWALWAMFLYSHFVGTPAMNVPWMNLKLERIIPWVWVAISIQGAAT